MVVSLDVQETNFSTQGVVEIHGRSGVFMLFSRDIRE